MGLSRSLRRLGIVAALAAAIVSASVAGALAAPPASLSLDQLQAKLDAAPGGTLDGYLRTVVRGSAIDTIPVTVQAITGGPTAGSTLILFEATGPVIDRIGGIAAGMSGSPIYVEDGGEDKVIGALSYGDSLTKGGSGLATPIEFMTAMQSTYGPLSLPLPSPEAVNGRTVRTILVNPAGSTPPAGYKPPAGVMVARPLAAIYIGGLRPGSATFKRLESHLASRGVSVVALGAPLAGGTAMSGGVPFSTELTAGAGVAALGARGDLWAGGVGTVTYSDGDDVVAFGHPMEWNGSTDLYMTNAWIDGIWPSIYVPYKMGRPGAVRGRITQDRTFGIMGQLDKVTAETTITSTITDTSTGRVATSTVFVPTSLIETGAVDGYLPAAAVTVAAEKLFDASVKGTIMTTTTIVVDDAGVERTVRLGNMHASGSEMMFFDELAGMVGSDVEYAVSMLQSVLGEGIQKPTIKSIDVATAYAPDPRLAYIVDVDAPAGLRAGRANRVRVSLKAYGLAATQTVDTTLTLPALPAGWGSGLSGDLIAEFGGGRSSGWGWGDPTGLGLSSTTIAGMVAEIDASLPNNSLAVIYDGPEYSKMTTTLAPWVLDGESRRTAQDISAAATPRTVAYNAPFAVSGVIASVDSTLTVKLYATTAGESTEHLVKTITVKPQPWGGGASWTSGPLRFTKSASIRAFVAADDDGQYTSAQATTDVKVGAAVNMWASSRSVTAGTPITLTASVLPTATAGSRVTFERWNANTRAWSAIGTVTLVDKGSAAVATQLWRPGKGTFTVRARFLGSVSNVGASSANYTVTGR